ncbi:DUF6988 family protein [Vibrio ouci]|uniref:Uncharacterized protein n=1 Tax=Vibrio ouci TaxID=2499078 RepID=A0A4Y8W953_9VIBR|nr:DUF5677 domain-containing protein [Vibrio ouci]TFH89449.1 hypothetical protein ELS82_22195 [Vibrio ouci]
MEIRIVEFTNLLDCIERELSTVKFKDAGTRVRLASALYTLVIDHAQGIRLLIEGRGYPSSSALLRVVFETYIRAAWFENCATDEQIKHFIDHDEILSPDKRKLSFGQLVDAVDIALDTDSYFSQVKATTWKGLNSLTHSGILQAERCVKEKSITYNYSTRQINEALEFSSMLVGLASGSLIDLSDTINPSDKISRITNLANSLIIESS